MSGFFYDIYVNNYFLQNLSIRFLCKIFLKMPDSQIPAVLVLEDGTICYGKAFGAIGTTAGEICFNTGMDSDLLVDKSLIIRIKVCRVVIKIRFDR